MIHLPGSGSAKTTLDSVLLRASAAAFVVGMVSSMVSSVSASFRASF